MASDSNFLSAINSGQNVNISNYFSRNEAKESSGSSIDAARNNQGSDTVSFSDAAKKLFADTSKNDVEVIQGLIDKAMDMLKSRSAVPDKIEKAYGLDAFNKKVGESRERLNGLVDKLSGALTNGDRNGAAAVEKEIRELFKGLESVKPEVPGAAGADDKKA